METNYGGHIILPSGYICHGESPFLIGKPSINAPFSMAILNIQRVPINWENNYG